LKRRKLTKRESVLKKPVGWKDYEERTAKLFRNLGCLVELGATVRGARAKHKVDVWIRFRRFGIEAKWVLDCKFWRTRVTKEKILALRAVVDDVGADRGVLVSQKGFQPGAVCAAEHTNVTLTSLEEMERTAQNDLILFALDKLETRAIAARHDLQGLYVYESAGPSSFTSTPRPGVDGNAVMRATGKLGILQFGFEYARLGKGPFPVAFDDTGNHQMVVTTLAEFVTCAATIIANAEATIQANKLKAD
jgi:hypothetical protein